MKKVHFKWLPIIPILILCGVFAAILLVYTIPMEDAVYDLSLMWEGEAMPEDWVFDDKGWTVFTQEGETATPLTADGFGGYSGLSYPGQTFYFSRKLVEDLDNPILQIGSTSHSFAVFLDGELLYTDCPELDNRIGYLDLPMLEIYHEDPLSVSLPSNYKDKTLTIAQSTEPGGGQLEAVSNPAYPSTVTLYCGYAYESTLIAESFQTALPALLAFIAGTGLLALFLLRGFNGKWDIGLICIALVAFFWMTYRIAVVSFSHSYFRDLPADVSLLCRSLSLTALLVFLASRLTGIRRRLLIILTILQGVGILTNVYLQITGNLNLKYLMIEQFVTLIIVSAVFACGLWEWQKGNRFFHLFSILMITGIGLYIVITATAIFLEASWSTLILNQLEMLITTGAISYFLQQLLILIMAVTLITTFAEGIHQESLRRIETRLLVQRQELAQTSYETMRHQHDEILMLRHDMLKHLSILQQMSEEGKAAAYIEELIGQHEAVHPVIQSGNEMLDIVLNSKLGIAADSGAKIEVIRSTAPGTLPLSNSELCSVIMNILDNAVAAVSDSETEQTWIQLDIHVKGGFFVFTCKNSANMKNTEKPSSTENIPEHGFGLKIIQQIVKRHGGLTKTEYGSDFFKITVAIPLP